MNLCDELVEYVLSYFVKEYSETEAYLNNEMLFATQSCRQLNDAKKRLLQNYSCQYAPITYAIQGGHIHQLEWFKQNGYRVWSSEKNTEWLCRYERIDILDWFHRSGTTLLLNSDTICRAERIVEDWLFQNGYPYNYYYWKIYNACRYGNIPALRHMIPKLTIPFMKRDAGKENMTLLEWFRFKSLDYWNGRDGIILFILNACKYGNTEILDWIWSLRPGKFTSNLLHPMIQCKWKTYYIRHACRNGHISVLDWFHHKNILTYDAWGLCLANDSGHIEVLNWFKERQYRLAFKKKELLKVEAQVYDWFRLNRYTILNQTPLHQWIMANIEHNPSGPFRFHNVVPR